VQKRFEAQGLSFQFFDGIRGKSGMIGNTEGGRTFAEGLSAGEIRCWRAHLGVLQKIVDEKIPFALIFEDDCVIENMTLFSQQISQFKALYDIKPWDWIKLFQFNKIKALKPIFQSGDVVISVPFKRGFSTVCYAVSRQGAEKFLKHSRHFLYEPIDRYLDNTHRSNVHLWVSDLGSVGLSSAQTESEINQIDEHARSPELQTTFQKLCNSLGMRLSAWRTYLTFKGKLNVSSESVS
jgi:GR25 family glycosyltransferase involved in LPS biosynthesis